MMSTETVQGFRISPCQRRSWSLAAAGQGAVWTASAWQLEGPLDEARLEAALAALVRRFEILRTRFESLAGLSLPVQNVEEGWTPPLARAPLAVLDGDLESWWRSLAERAWDPRRDPPLEVTLVRRGPEDHLLLVVLPALNADAATVPLLVRELARHYAEPAAPELAAEVPQYPDLAEWQNDLLESADTAAGRDFWRRQGAPAAPRLPFEGGAPESPAFRPSWLRTALPPEVAGRLDHLASAGGAPASTFCLGAWMALLGRLSEAPRFPVGVAFEGRRHSLLAGALGPLTRFAPLVAEVGGPVSVSLGPLAESLEAASKRIEYFDPAPQAEAAGAPAYLFETLPAIEPWRQGPLGWRLLRQSCWGERFTAKLGWQAGDGTLELGFDPQILAPADAARLLGWTRRLLELASAEPSRPWESFELLSAEERADLEALGATDLALGEEDGTLRRFWRQVDRAGESTALCFGDEWLSYGELGVRVSGLARRLVAAGVAAETRVGVLLERSLELPVAVLAVLEAGGAFVPLDPSYPAQRLRHMAEQGDLRVVLLAGPAPIALPSGVIALDLRALQHDPGLAGAPAAEPAAAGPESLAYVIYTSGSTGLPKGVMVRRVALDNHLRWLDRAYGLDAGAVCLQKTPISFDVSVRELFWPLCSGARLVVAEPQGHRDPAYLLELIGQRRITVVNFVPSLLSAFLALPGVEGCGVRRIISGGAELTPELRDRCLERLPAALNNQYGPTEVTITGTWAACDGDLGRPAVPIGRPIANARCTLVDRHFVRVPWGFAGELVIGGEGLARGYLGEPAKTAAAFVPDPWSGRPGARVYRTGDLCRLTPAGELLFLGRVDHQVKVRGFRVELGEVEAVLRAHPGVAEAVVAALDGPGGEKSLAAYLVPRAAGELDLQELRAWAAKTLPEYMVPAAWSLLRQLPVNPSGKVDRGALPAPAWSGRESAAERPLTPSEELVAEVFAELLGVERGHPRLHFFESGGHSLLATQAVSRLRQLLRREIPLRLIFEAPTVEALARRLEAPAEEESGEISAIVPRSRDGALPLSFAQQRLWFLEQLEAGPGAFNIPMTLELEGNLDARALATAFNGVVARHEVLRTRIVTEKGEPRLEILPAVLLPFALIDLDGLAAEDRSRLALALAQREGGRPFQLDRPPLLRITLLRHAAASHWLLLTFHHIASDAWSASVLLAEVGELYPAAMAGRPGTLAPLPIQYLDFAAWQREWLAGERRQRQLDYWRSRLLGAPPTLELPTDHPRPAVAAAAGATLPVQLGAELTTALRQLARRQGCTLFMALMAAYQVVLHQRTGRRDVVVGTDVANRHRAEVERLIGFFVNQLVFRGDLEGDPTVAELLARVREQALEAYAHQDLPFESIVELLRPERRTDAHPVFQTKLFLLNVPRTPLALPGLVLKPVFIDPGIARLDLTLSLTEAPEGLEGWLNFRADLFEPATARAFFEDFEAVLRAFVERPEARLGELAEEISAQRRRSREEQRRLHRASAAEKLARRAGARATPSLETRA
ncbi:MAG TPA: amino acid adenylation domain-containing protein [Thermoanaerobaculia bacterium]|nr:amino acid adenylation domain-containing protein [Thermoanaerobaculia bacterium]